MVTDDYVGQAISVTVTDADGNEATSEETALVTADKSFDVALVDNDGLQDDGTALVGDELAITYGSTFGTVSAITWYVNGAVKDVTVPGAGLNLDQVTTRAYIGEVYAIVENTDKEKAQTNTITVTDVEQPIEVSDIEILNDYDSPTLTYAAADDDAIITVTMSKAVDGDLYIYKDSVSKYGNGNNAFLIEAADFGKTIPVDKASQLTAKKAVEVAAADDFGGETGIYFKNVDGSTTYMIKADDGDMANQFSPTRGATYKAVFDQDAISTDNIGAATRADVTVSDPFTAPYVIAPASIALTSHSAGSVPKITFYDEEGEVLTWLGNPADDEVEAYGISNVTTYGETGSTKAKAKKTAQGITDGDSTIEKGVITGDTALNAASSYFWATVTTTKGIFGAKAETLESDIVEGAEAPLATMNIVDDSTNPKDAVITFTKLKTAGTVYILQGTGAGDDDNGVDDFDADDVSTYVGKADVEKGDTKVTIADAIESYADSATSGRYYTAYFVPENTEDYSIYHVNTYANTKQKVKDAEVSNNLLVAQIPTSIAFDDDAAEDTVTSYVVAIDKKTTISDEVTGAKIKAYDQFGDLVEGGQAPKTVTSCVAKNATLTTTEDANAQYEIEAATGNVEIHLYRNAAVDAGDGFDITILGSKVTLKNTTGALVDNAAGTGNFEVTLGSNKVATGWTSALGTAGVTFNTITGALTPSQVLADYTGELEAGATAGLEESNDGVTWTAATNGILSVDTVNKKITENATPATVTANTYYRIKVSAPGFADGYVTMTGDKTATAALTTMTLGTGTVNAASAFTVSITAAKDQFGGDIAVPALATTSAISDSDGTASTVTVTYAVTPGAVGAGTITITPSATLATETATYSTTYAGKTLSTVITAGTAAQSTWT